MRSRHGVFFIASTVVSTAQNTCFVAPLTGATNVEIRQRHREECEKLSEEHQYIETTLSTASHSSGRKRLPAVIGACISSEPVADCEAEVRSYMERTFQEGCRDGHPEGHLLWAQWLSKALEDAHKQEGYLNLRERLEEHSVSLPDVISWNAIYECPAASCALLFTASFNTGSPEEFMASLDLQFDKEQFLETAERMQFCYEELLENGQQQEIMSNLDLIIAVFEFQLSHVRFWSHQFRPRNPHHDEGRTVWHDYYSGLYQPVDYSEQFDLQWELALERPDSNYAKESSVRLDNCTLNDMIASTFGRYDYHFCSTEALKEHEILERGISRTNFVTLDLERFQDADALDVGCGFGRWTAMLKSIGAKVTSVDASPSAVMSTRRFNKDTHQMSLFDLPKLEKYADGFDLVVCWGVLHHTHDPYKGFKMVSNALREGGVLFIQVYNDRAKAGFHYTQSFRARFHQLKTDREKLEFLKKTHRAAGADFFDHLDGMLTFYNWVIHEETVRNWFLNNGFADYWKVWNYKYLGRKRPILAPVRDDSGMLLRNEIGESSAEGRNYPIITGT